MKKEICGSKRRIALPKSGSTLEPEGEHVIILNY